MKDKERDQGAYWSEKGKGLLGPNWEGDIKGSPDLILSERGKSQGKKLSRFQLREWLHLRDFYFIQSLFRALRADED